MSRLNHLSLALLLLASPGLADVHPNTAGGFPADKIFDSGGIDNVSLFNGQLVLTIPIGGSYPVNGGFSYSLKLVYNSNPWRFQEVTRLMSGVEVTKTQALPSECSNAGLGWRVSFGQLDPLCQLPDGFPDPNRPVYQDETGTDHIFYATLHEGDPEDVLPSGVVDVRYTRSSDYLRLLVKSNGTRLVEEPNGTVRTFDSAGRPTEIRDQFGNGLSIAYSTNLWTITDSVGRAHAITFASQPGFPQTVSEIRLASVNGGTGIYGFAYTPSTVGRPCPHNDNGLAGSVGPTAFLPFLTQVTLPDGSKYTASLVDYVTAVAAGECTDHAGNITALNTRLGGRLEWVWQTFRFPTGSSVKKHLQSNSGVASRALRDPASPATVQQRLTYVQAPASPAVLTTREVSTSVTDLAGVRREHFFSVAGDPTLSTTTWSEYDYSLPFTRNVTQASTTGTTLNLSSRVWQGSTLLRSEFVAYERETPATGTPADRFNTNRRMKQTRTVFHDDPATPTPFAEETLSDFDGLGHNRARNTAGNFPGNNVRSSHTGYNPAQGTWGVNFVMKPAIEPWVLGTYTFAWESEAGQLLYRSFCFNSLGFLLGRRVHGTNGSAKQANDLVEVFTPAANGNIVAEKYFGGDAQATIPTGTLDGFICTLTNTLSNPTYQVDHTYQNGVRSKSTVTVGGVPINTLDQSIDQSTGLPSSSRDSAGAQTAYLYDTLGRLTRVTPPNGAVTQYTYSVAASSGQVEITTDSGGINFGHQRINYDAFGRVALEEDHMPDNNFAPRRTTYLPVGYRGFVSEKGAVGFGTTFVSYDAFGRPLTIRPADGGVHDVTLTYKGVREITRTSKVATSATTETPKTTTETYDRFGRLFEVVEPNGSKTRYSYDAGNRLKSVCQAWTAPNSCGQTRIFNYDNRGLLTFEQHPEKGAFGNGTVSYFDYDARGHALRKVDGPNDLSFSYDALERLTLIRETGGAQRVLKTFTYATANSGADLRKGKLLTASRFNYVGAPFNATVEIRDTFVYAGRGGRISQKDTQMLFNGGSSESFRQSLVWDPAGNLSSHTYPDCTATSLCGASSPRTVTYGYTRGRLTGIPGFLNGVEYHLNGMFSALHRSNGISDFQSRAANWLPRPFEIYALRDVDAFGYWTTGGFVYDGSGNVWKMGASTFVYDDLSRVASGTVYPTAYVTGTAHKQSYSFDLFGNIQSITTQIGAGTPSTLSTTTSTTTNRLNAGNYDAAGNMTSWSGNSYGYDAFNQMVRHVSSGEDWRYIYTADDERFWAYKVGGGGSIWTLRDLGGKVARQYSSHLGWSNYRDYIHRGATLFATADSSGAGAAIRHLHPDHLGTPRLITDSSGNPATATFHTYYPFGEEIAGTFDPAYTEKLRFTGHERDLVNSGGQGDDLDYMHARHCSPVTGRFFSVDPGKEAEPNEPQTWNRYSYTAGNPLRWIDPNGEYRACPADGCPKPPTTFLEKTLKGFDEAAILPGPMAMAAAPRAAGGILPRAVQFLARLFGFADEAARVAPELSRALTVADLGIKGSVIELKGTYSVAEGLATVRVDMIRGKITNPLQIVGNLIQLAKNSGATTLRIEGVLANPKLYEVLAKRYGLTTQGAVDAIVIVLKKATS